MFNRLSYLHCPQRWEWPLPPDESSPSSCIIFILVVLFLSIYIHLLFTSCLSLQLISFTRWGTSSLLRPYCLLHSSFSKLLVEWVSEDGMALDIRWRMFLMHLGGDRPPALLRSLRQWLPNLSAPWEHLWSFQRTEAWLHPWRLWFNRSGVWSGFGDF